MKCEFNAHSSSNFDKIIPLYGHSIVRLVCNFNFECEYGLSDLLIIMNNNKTSL